MKFDLTIEHVIQQEIIKKLTYAASLRFSELKPKELESNLFMYHLKCLMKLDFVEKNDSGGYQLTPKGLAHVDKLSLKDLKHRVQAKLITILAIDRPDGKWLMLERLHQPFIHRTGFPSGKMHFHESIQEAAERELKDKNGISGVELTLRGSVAICFTLKGEPISHVIGYVFRGHVDEIKDQEHNSNGGRGFWADTTKLKKDDLIPGYWEIQELLKSEQLFFKEMSFKL